MRYVPHWVLPLKVAFEQEACYDWCLNSASTMRRAVTVIFGAFENETRARWFCGHSGNTPSSEVRLAGRS